MQRKGHIKLYTIWKCLRASELLKTKIFPTSFGGGCFQGNLLKFIYISNLNFKRSFKRLKKNRFPKLHQLHEFFNRNNLKVSYISLPNFKSVINGHNGHNDEQEKPSPWNCSDKTSCMLVKRKLPR